MSIALQEFAAPQTGGGGGGGGTGDVTGPASSTDNTVVRMDGTTGKVIQQSAVTIDDSGNVSGVGTLASGTVTVTGNIVVSGTVDGRDVSNDGTTLDGHTTSLATKAIGIASVTDNKLVRFDGTGGKQLQDSAIVVDDSGNITGAGTYNTVNIATLNTTVAANTTAIAGKADLNYTLNDQTGTTYAPVLTDAGKLVTLSNASAITVTIPANASVAFPVGTIIAFLQKGAGQVTFAITSDTLNNPGLTNKTRTQWSRVTLEKISSTVWVISGDLAAS